MDATNVRPQKWFQDKTYPIKVLFDDGDYSIIWGKFENNIAMGVRWNGGDVGYPRQGVYPTWYVEPDFIAIGIIQNILTKAIDKPNCSYYHIENINFALKELTRKLISSNKKQHKPDC